MVDWICCSACKCQFIATISCIIVPDDFLLLFTRCFYSNCIARFVCINVYQYDEHDMTCYVAWLDHSIVNVVKAKSKTEWLQKDTKPNSTGWEIGGRGAINVYSSSSGARIPMKIVIWPIEFCVPISINSIQLYALRTCSVTVRSLQLPFHLVLSFLLQTYTHHIYHCNNN